MSDTPDDLEARTDDKLAHALAELVLCGVGCPRAVQLGGPGVVDNWIDEQYDNLAAAAEEAAETVETAEAERLTALEDREAEDAVAREGAEVTDDDGDRHGPYGGDAVANAIQELEGRMADQESQGRDQWAAIEANTAARIEAHQKATRPKRKRVTPGKPKKKKGKG